MMNDDGIRLFHLFYRKYYRILVLYAVKLGTDTAVAEDIVQAAFTKMLENGINYDQELPARAYIYTAVHHLCLDTLKHRSVVNGALFPSNDLLANDPDEEIMDHDEVLRRVLDMIESMPPRQREVFLLLMQGKTMQDIARMMQVSENTVKMHKKRGMKTLRQKLSGRDLCLIATILF